MRVSTLARQLRQSVSYRQALSQDERADRTYGEAFDVQARKVSISKDMIAKDGEMTAAQNRVTLLFEPSIGDQLDGDEVIRVDSLTDYRGVTVGWQAYTR